MTFRHYFTLVDTMARMALKADAARFFFGYLWWVLEPLLYVAVFYVVFEVVLGNKRPDFLVFLMCGKLTFIWFSKSVNQASRSIVASKGLIGKVDVPKSLFPLATIQEGLYKQASVFLLLFIVLWFKGYGVSPGWAWLIPVVLVNYLMIVGLSLFGAFLVCLAFDFSMLISLGMIFLLFTSGIFWDVRGLADPAMTEAVLVLNPVAFIIDAYRQVLMEGAAPDLAHLAAVAAGAAALVAAGVLLLRRTSRFLALKAITA
ncbi:ABC transporter permease [Pseudohaliea rubra]|uniref:Transport permease protein n=1 Tax=Pseudohaliea rubra DSM 19751 TaxID=1265313 RepID=A0A095WYX1_9GAMM|nr:ABC transporter permease [Pseudohaliea rubra]KGE03839.1 O-antigen export system permease protein RfbD [Pseudohaliea rubra DSM 19751]